ncbi:MAG: carboxylesterase family protein [Oscillospiraceae bacterium]|nr:carboxylesterase family protein [Oscillospiraceae bacterium]
MKAGAWAALAVIALLFGALLVLSKSTVWGWVLALLLLASFAMLYGRVERGWLRTACWLGLLILFALTLKLGEAPYRAIPAVSAKDPAVTEIVQVSQGKLTGVYNEDGSVEVYAGIPYAKPPVGELRWREPQEPESWEGVRACDTFAPMSMQQRNPAIVDSLTTIVAFHNFRYDPFKSFREPVSEDSLYLNIWKPAGEVKDAPVLFFIHGGSLQTGQPSYGEYNGESLAKQGVIVVNFGYRLNIFGYFASEELAAESPNGTTGNYGLLDQIAALRWVHENIAAFGGDADNITIAGESAGASSVGALCVSPLAKGLFRRAVAESSGITPVKPYHTFRAYDDALELGRKVLAEQGAANVQALRAIPAEKLLSSADPYNAMTVDGYAITEQPYLTYERGENNEEALLNGFNSHEADLFNFFLKVSTGNYDETLRAIFAGHTDEVEALYPAATDAEAKANVNTILSAAWFAYSHYDWSRCMTAQGKPVYEYCFTRANGGLSNNHGGEMPYVFGNLGTQPYNYAPEDWTLSERMQRYWVNFARTGDPNGEGLPYWPTYAESPGRPLKLDAKIEPVEDPYLKLYEIIDLRQREIRDGIE